MRLILFPSFCNNTHARTYSEDTRHNCLVEVKKIWFGLFTYLGTYSVQSSQRRTKEAYNIVLPVGRCVAE